MYFSNTPDNCSMNIFCSTYVVERLSVTPPRSPICAFHLLRHGTPSQSDYCCMPRTGRSHILFFYSSRGSSERRNANAHRGTPVSASCYFWHQPFVLPPNGRQNNKFGTFCRFEQCRRSDLDLAKPRVTNTYY